MFVNYGVNDRSKLKTYSLERAESSFAAYIYACIQFCQDKYERL